MSSNGPDTDQRIEELAAAARKLTNLSVAEQYQKLTAEGLRLSDTGWEKVSDPDGLGLQRHVTVIPVVNPQSA